jgi:hypothetical protein
MLTVACFCRRSAVRCFNGKASSLLKIVDIDEKFEIENKATVMLAKELGLVA